MCVSKLIVTAITKKIPTSHWHNTFGIYVFFMSLSSAGLKESSVLLSHQDLLLLPSSGSAIF